APRPSTPSASSTSCASTPWSATSIWARCRRLACTTSRAWTTRAPAWRPTSRCRVRTAPLGGGRGLSRKRARLAPRAPAAPTDPANSTAGAPRHPRLNSKFFLIDGTVISGAHGFYGHVNHIFQTAQHNAPSILFIDDSDVIFESGEELGLYRYLLTMLDG